MLLNVIKLLAGHAFLLQMFDVAGYQVERGYILLIVVGRRHSADRVDCFPC
jgi:hypothetical protein